MNRRQRSQWRSAVLALAGMSLLAFFSVAQAQGGSDASEITGEASVVIFDDFVSGRSEIRYFLTNLKGKECRLYLDPTPTRVCEAGDTTRCSDWVTVSY